MSKNILIYVLILIVVYLYFKVDKLDKKITVTKEGMTNVDTVKNLINNIYKGDIQSIRNLAKISKNLQSGGLTIPGNLTVEGSLFVKKGADIKGTTAADKVNLRGCQLYKGSFSSLVIKNSNGYLDIGPKNSSWSHFITDRPNFYFNRAGHFDGDSQKYKGPKYASTTDINNIKRNYLKSGDTTILYNRSHGAYIENCGHYRAACSGGYGLRSVSDKNRILRGSGKFTISKV